MVRIMSFRKYGLIDWFEKERRFGTSTCWDYSDSISN